MIKTFIVGACKNHLAEAVITSTHNLYFEQKQEKYHFFPLKIFIYTTKIFFVYYMGMFSLCIPFTQCTDIAGVPFTQCTDIAGVPFTQCTDIAGVPFTQCTDIAGVPFTQCTDIAGVPFTQCTDIAGGLIVL